MPRRGRSRPLRPPPGPDSSRGPRQPRGGVTRPRHRDLLEIERLKPVSDARGPESSGQPITLEFDDNRLLALLSGEHDRYLARIEQQFGVAVTPRGNLLMISGAADAQARARIVLTELYGRLDRKSTRLNSSH